MHAHVRDVNFGDDALRCKKSCYLSVSGAAHAIDLSGKSAGCGLNPFQNGRMLSYLDSCPERLPQPCGGAPQGRNALSQAEES
jgi:hypothetical protein